MADPELERYLEQELNQSQRRKILAQILKEGTIKRVKEIPKKVRKAWVTTHEIGPEWHVKIQAAWQKWMDNSVSKTINFAQTAAVDEVEKAYLLGWKLGLKGITIYRDGSKLDQVLNVKGGESQLSADVTATRTTEPCPECGGQTQFADGCVSCPNCGWSKCSM